MTDPPAGSRPAPGPPGSGQPAQAPPAAGLPVAGSAGPGLPVVESAGSGPPGADLPPLARSTLDRAAHLRTDEAWLAAAWPAARVLVVDIAAGGVAGLVDGTQGPELVLLPSAVVDSGPPGQASASEPLDRLFLGLDDDGAAIFAVVAPLPLLPGSRAANLHDVGHALSARDAGLFTAALALANWHAGHGFSPATGEPTTIADGGWVRLSPGGRQVWPRTDPAIIALVHDGAAGADGRCLLGHAALWRGPGMRRFSCLAGFVEAGESAEAAVAREIREEAGIGVDRIEYVASQAWPFPGSLMLGFTAYADPAQPIRVDVTEIAEARWFSRREVAAVYAGQRVELGDGDALLLPFGTSIAAFLIGRWLAGK